MTLAFFIFLASNSNIILKSWQLLFKNDSKEATRRVTDRHRIKTLLKADCNQWSMSMLSWCTCARSFLNRRLNTRAPQRLFYSSATEPSRQLTIPIQRAFWKLIMKTSLLLLNFLNAERLFHHKDFTNLFVKVSRFAWWANL